MIEANKPVPTPVKSPRIVNQTGGKTTNSTYTYQPPYATHR